MSPAAGADLPVGLLPGWRPALVALDIDGTAVRAETDEVSPAVVEAVARARAEGAHVVLATGRGVLGVRDVAVQLGLGDQPAVCSNGAVTAVPERLEVLHAVTFDCGPAVRIIQQSLPEAIVAVERPGLGYAVTRPFPPDEVSGEQLVLPVEEIVARPVSRMVVRWPGAELEEFVARVEAAGLHGVNYAIGYSAWLDVMPPGVSKASALEVLREELGVPGGRTAAFGDGRNDLEMIAWAAHGVAMGEAVLEVQDAADEVTLSAHDDGVAHVLTRWFPPA
ncbi:MAG TPA: HAD family hydrolase [Actinomycetes bacterium]|nr:HAD family hydrolase [Actinomycetes bacterium]